MTQGCGKLAISIGSSNQKIFGSQTISHEERLLVSIMFYGSVAMLFFGAFIMRYKLELIISFPMIALVMSTYLAMSFKKHSAAQAPEKLYREPFLMIGVVGCSLLMGLRFFIDIPKPPQSSYSLDKI